MSLIRILSSPWQRTIEHFVTAFVLVIAALFLSVIFFNSIHSTPFAFFYGAVALVAYMGGLAAGLAATCLSIILVELLLIAPIWQFGDGSGNFSHLVIFASVAVLISWLNHSRLASLRQSTRRRDELQALLTHIDDAVTAQDEKGQVVFANKAAARLTGYSSVESMIGLTAESAQRRFAMYDEAGQPLSYDHLPRQRVFRQGVGGTIRFKLRYLDNGAEKWVHLSTAPLLDENKKPRLAVNIFRDITESMDAQHRLRQILDNLPALVGMLDLEGTLLEANRMALNLANLKRDDVIGKHFAESYWWSYDPHIQAELRQAITRAQVGEVVRYDVDVRIGEGRFATIDFILSPIRNEAGLIYALLPSAVDITERRRIEKERAVLSEEIEKQHTRLETILDSVPGLVWEGVGKPDGTQKLIYVNRYAQHLLGYPVERWYQDPPIWSDIVVPEDMPLVVEQAMNIFTGTQPGVIKFRLKARDGRIIPVESYSAIVQRGLDDQSTRMCGVIMDVSASKRDEALLEKYMLRLKISNDELRQFAYVASHDLQEPLRMVSSYLQLIESRYHAMLDDDGREFIRYAVDGAIRMKRLIQDLLLYSRVEMRNEQYTRVDMNTVLAEVKSNLEITIAQTGTIIHAEPLPEISADHGQMVQLMQNLVSNAIKFRGQALPEITIGAEKVRDAWLFSVRDNGIGIDPKYHDRIFVIFQRLHEHGKYPGTGIGLAICKRVAERHGGRIWFTSEPGNFTTFYFTIADYLQNGREGDHDVFA